MKCIIPEISWNNRDPVFSLDIQPKVDEFTRLATAGSDTHIVIWHLTVDENGSINIEPAADLNKHQKAVNVVRWSPSGELLAAGDDESNIILWKQRQDIDQTPCFEKDLDANETNSKNDEEYKENWYIYKILRGHMDDVYDISWSPDSKQLLSGSVDNTAIVWNITNKTKHILQPNHKGFVQGVSWDPLNQYCATLSSDRVCRVFDLNTKRMISKSSKGTLPFNDTSPLHGQTCRLYHDDTLKSYFRRLTFSPDGKLLIAPAGSVESEHCPKKIYFTYVYTRYSFKQPTLALPSPDQFTVAVRCCPILFELRADGPQPPMIPLPYRMIIAVASQTTITFYDTQQCEPFATITNIHYTRITDITWSSNAQIVAVSSTDGFCSLILFKSQELGIPYKPPQQTTSSIEIVDNETEKQPNIMSPPATMMDVDIDNKIKACCIEEASQDIKLYLESEDTTQDTIDKDNTAETPKMDTNTDNNTEECQKKIDIDEANNKNTDNVANNNNNAGNVEDNSKNTQKMDTDNNVEGSHKEIVNVPDNTRNIKNVENKKNTDNVDDSNKNVNNIKDSNINNDKSDKDNINIDKVEDNKKNDNTEDDTKMQIQNDNTASSSASVTTPKPPRRVTFITLSSPKGKSRKKIL